MNRPHTHRDGFTLIEVMVTVTIITVGAVGIMALQQASTRGNMSARRMTQATQISRTWIERLRRDSLNWNGAGVPANADYLSQIPPAQDCSNWFVPQPPNNPVYPHEDAEFDYQGTETDISGARTAYCAQVRLCWVSRTGACNAGARGCDAIRATVRTWWNRRGGSGISNPQGFSCGNNPQNVDAELASTNPKIRAVSASTVIHWKSMVQQ